MAYTSVFNNKKYTKLHYLANQKSNRVNYFGFLVGVFFYNYWSNPYCLTPFG